MVNRRSIIVTILVTFILLLGNNLIAELSCKASFESSLQKAITYNSAGVVIEEAHLKKLRGLPDGEYNFLVFKDGSISLGPKYHIKEGSTKAIISHSSLLNRYTEIMDRTNKPVSEVDLSGSLVILNRVVTHINGKAKSSKDQYSLRLLAFIKQLKDKGVKISELTKVNQIKSSHQQDLENIRILREVNENPNFSLIYMTVKRLNQSLYELFPSHTQAGIVDINQLAISAQEKINNPHSKNVLTSIEKFLGSVNNNGTLKTAHKYFEQGKVHLKNENPKLFGESLEQEVVNKFNKFYQLAISLSNSVVETK